MLAAWRAWLKDSSALWTATLVCLVLQLAAVDACSVSADLAHARNAGEGLWSRALPPLQSA